MLVRRHIIYPVCSGIIFFLALCHISLFSQGPITKNFDDLEGLPSLTVYDILQDETACLWIATDNGIAVYDGTTFRSYTIEDGLSDLSIIHLYNDRHNRIWGMGYNGTLSCIDNHEIVNTQRINTLITSSILSYVDDMYIDSLDRIWIAPRYGGILRVDNDSTIVSITRRQGTRGNYTLFFSDFDGDIFIATIHDDNTEELLPPGVFSGEQTHYVPMEGHLSVLHRNVLKLDEGEYLVSFKRTLLHLKNGEVVLRKIFNQRIIDLQKDQFNNIWVSVSQEGVYFFENRELNRVPEQYFKGETASRVIQDFDGGYWISTIQNGLYYISNPSFILIPDSRGRNDHNVLSLTSSGDCLYHTTFDQHIYRIKGQENPYQSTDFIIDSITDYLFSINIDPNNRLWISGTHRIVYSETGAPVFPFDVPRAMNYHSLKDGRTVATHFNGILILKDGVVIEIPDDEFDKRIFKVYEDEHGTIWLATLSGLYTYQNRKYIPYNVYPDLVNKRITDIVKTGGHYFVGTANSGLYAFNDDSIVAVRNKFPGGIGKVNCFENEGDSVLWIGTSLGLVRLTYDEDNPGLPEQLRYLRTEGLPGNRINDLEIFDDRLWIGTDRGLVCFGERHRAPIQSAPKISVTSIIINDNPVETGPSLDLKNKENNIRFNFKGISLRGSENVNYRFMLGGHDKEILYTSDPFVNYSNLSSGKYYFFVNAGNANGVWNSNPNTTIINIRKAFTETALFYVLLAAGVFLLTAITFYIINSIQRRRNNLKEQVVTMQQRLLRSQMNPHFVFNSLLSIQSFIYKNEPAIAGKYLSSFAKLIRLILNSSRKDYISLDDEVQFLEHYLELQKLRFAERFDYQFEIDDRIKPEMIQIPPMLAQPFIENAVEHGLKNISRDGLIIIRFYLDDSTLVFEIEDNGIGIHQSLKEVESSIFRHESLGQQITTDRLKLLNQSRGKKVSFSIEELKDAENEVCGTKVSFRITL